MKKLALYLFHPVLGEVAVLEREPSISKSAGKMPTFALAGPQWLESRRPFLSKSTLATYKEFLAKLLVFFGPMSLDSITADHVRAYQIERSKIAGGERINHELGCVLRPVLKRAKLWAAINDDYERLPERESTAGRSLEPEQEERLWELASSRTEWRVAYRCAQLAANTTASARELKAVKIKNVELDCKIPKLHIPCGKNKYRVRDVPLNDDALEAIKDLLKRAKELGCVEPDHYLLPFLMRTKVDGEKGNQYDPTRPMTTWRWAWRRLTRAAGLRGLRFHDLRHHAISVMGEEGVPDRTIMEVAGHVTTEMLGRYSHHRAEAKKRAVDTLKRRPVQNSEKPKLLRKIS